MDLYLIRHAIAEEPQTGQEDLARALTPQGRARFRGIVRGMEQLELCWDLLQHSPARRAVESAELLSTLVDGESEVNELLYAPPSEELLQGLRGESCALVGHEPWLSELAFWLISGWRHYDGKGAALPISLKKGGVLHLCGLPRPGEMSLAALYPPRALRRLGKR